MIARLASMSLKRRLAERAGRILGVYIVPKGEAWSLPERNFLEQFLAAFQVDCVFDVGANDGGYARRLRIAGFKGPIVSFEPIPRLADALRKMARGDPNWFIEEIALHETEKRTEFKVTALSVVSSCLDVHHTLTKALPHSHRVVETLALTTGTLSTYFDKYKDRLGFGRPFLKTDAQGADLSVAKGAGAQLREFVGLQSELSFVPIYEGQDNDFQPAIAFYEENGFELAALLPVASPLFPRLAEVDCVMFNSRFAEVRTMDARHQLP
jgi:FkbM family methyltransferase